jgi:hypothetical protein
MIWLAAKACTNLPEAVTDWARFWPAGSAEHHRALVGILEAPLGYAIGRSPARADLVRLAEVSGLELFLRSYQSAPRRLVEGWPGDFRLNERLLGKSFRLGGD